MSSIEYKAEELDPLILCADNHLLAVNKPAGLLSQDSGTGLRNLEDWAREWVRVDKNKEGNVFLNAVHRIDKAVSGVVLFARTSKALSRLNEDIRKRNCRKIYHALVEGHPDAPSGELIHWLAHEHHIAEVCNEGDRGAQRAVLRYRTINTIPIEMPFGGTSSSMSMDAGVIATNRGNLVPPPNALALLEIDLETGRYHQIRAQLAAIGCPIAGDTKYGARLAAAEGDIALHHVRLEITHPTTRETLLLEAPYPNESEWWSRL